MARTFGVPHPPLRQSILQDPYRFEFFQAVRILESLVKDQKLKPYAKDGLPVLFRTQLTSGFPSSEIHDLKPASDENAPFPYEMTIAFMGLTGASGVLPHHYTETLIHRKILKKDTSAHAFFDMFNHRLVELFYHAWKKYRFWLDDEQDHPSIVRQSLISVIGLGTKGLQNRLSHHPENDPRHPNIDDNILIFHAGLLSQHPSSESNLQQLLSNILLCPVKINHFSGRWVIFDNHEKTSLGHRNHRLGQTTVLGYRSWDHASIFQVILGPLPYDQFKNFLPKQGGLIRAFNLIRLFVGMELDFEVIIGLDKNEVPRCRLSSKKDEAKKLGNDTWLVVKKPENDCYDAKFRVRSLNTH